MKRIILMLVISISAVQAQQSDLYIPFGGRRSLPSKESVTLIDTKVGIEAQQVCGYTDWTTATIHLPKKLISKQYWKSVGSKAVNMAKNTLLNLSGALPGMLACNASPTFCNLWNHTEVMAAFEAQITKDDCKILENLEDSSSLQASALRNCIKSVRKSNSDFTPGQARERCLVSENNPEKALSNSEKINRASSIGSEDRFRTADLMKALFPKDVEIDEGGNVGKINVSKTGRKYSMAKFTKTLIPGLSLDGTAVIYKSGTYNSVLDTELDNRIHNTRKGLYQIMREIREYQDRGHSPSQIVPILRTKYGQDYKSLESQSIYQQSFDGATRVEVIPLELLVQVAASIKQNENELDTKNTLSSLMLEKLAKEKIYNDMAVELGDLRLRVDTVCPVDPTLQKKEAQLNCASLQTGIISSIQSLQIRRESEDRLIKTQLEIAKMAEVAQGYRYKESLNIPLFENKNKKETEIPIPFKR